MQCIFEYPKKHVLQLKYLVFFLSNFMHYFYNIYSLVKVLHKASLNTHLRIRRLGDHFAGLMATLHPISNSTLQSFLLYFV